MSMSITALHSLKILTAFLLTTLPFHGNSQQVNNPEKNILLKLKQFWSHPPLLNQWSSAESSDHCTWPGITCTENSVTGLNISSRDVTGEVPPFICDLKNLTLLDFSNNYIPGTFPKGLYNCSNLRYLDLSRNYFVGVIPGDVDKLSHLVFLNLEANNFTGDVPAAIGQLSELVTLKLCANLFNGSFTPEIGNLSNLEVLEMSQGSNPWKLTSLTFLSTLNLSENHLSGAIPKGSQFDTFSNESFLGNLALCGVPLTKKCRSDEFPTREVDDDLDDDNKWFEWKILLMGYGCGLIFGLSMGYLFFTTLKPKWFLIFVKRAEQKLIRRYKKNT